MGGLSRICEIYGSIEFIDVNGQKTKFLWDYHKKEARLKSEMTKEDIELSEKAKWEGIRGMLK